MYTSAPGATPTGHHTKKQNSDYVTTLPRRGRVRPPPHKEVATTYHKTRPDQHHSSHCKIIIYVTTLPHRGRARGERDRPPIRGRSRRSSPPHKTNPPNPSASSHRLQRGVVLSKGGLVCRFGIWDCLDLGFGIAWIWDCLPTRIFRL